MRQLSNPFKGNVFRITQAKLHGYPPVFIDANSGNDIVAPCDVEVKGTLLDTDKVLGKIPNNNYFEMFNSDFMIRAIHAYLIVPAGKYREGTIIARLQDPGKAMVNGKYISISTPFLAAKHLHIGIKVTIRPGKVEWKQIVQFLNHQTIKLAVGPGFTPAETIKYTNWATWGNEQLNIVSLFPTPSTPIPVEPTPPPVVNLPEVNPWEVAMKRLGALIGYNGSLTPEDLGETLAERLKKSYISESDLRKALEDGQKSSQDNARLVEELKKSQSTIDALKSNVDDLSSELGQLESKSKALDSIRDFISNLFSKK